MCFWLMIGKIWYRWPGFILATLMFLCGIGCIVQAWHLSSSDGTELEFWKDLLINSSTSLLSIALTVGLIDYLFALRKMREHVESVRPHAREFVEGCKTLASAVPRHLPVIDSIPSDALAHYSQLLHTTIGVIERLRFLVADQNPSLAARLTTLIGDAEAHLVDLHHVIYAVEHNADDEREQTDRLRESATVFTQNANQIASVVSESYSPSEPTSMKAVTL